MIAVVAGGTGLTGRFVVQKLLLDPQISEVVSVSRRSTGQGAGKLREVLVKDLGEISANAARLKGDLYFCCLGTTIKVAGSQEAFSKVDLTAVADFAKVAKGHGAKALCLVSAMGADRKSLIFYNRVKGEAEAELSALSLRSLTVFRPAMLAGPRVEHRAGEKAAMTVIGPLAKLLGRRLGKLIVTDAEHLAGRMVEEAKAAAPGNRVIVARNI